MIFDPINESALFGNGQVKLEAVLKNPNQFKEAVIYDNLRSLPTKKLREFVNSKEAKTMLNEGLISTETLERLANESDTGCLKTTVCHMAKENGDPEWDELVKLRIEERRVMNELIDKYADRAKVIADNEDKIAEACIPEYFRS